MAFTSNITQINWRDPTARKATLKNAVLGLLANAQAANPPIPMRVSEVIAALTARMFDLEQSKMSRIQLASPRFWASVPKDLEKGHISEAISDLAKMRCIEYAANGDVVFLCHHGAVASSVGPTLPNAVAYVPAPYPGAIPASAAAATQTASRIPPAMQPFARPVPAGPALSHAYSSSAPAPWAPPSKPMSAMQQPYAMQQQQQQPYPAPAAGNAASSAYKVSIAQQSAMRKDVSSAYAVGVGAGGQTEQAGMKRPLPWPAGGREEEDPQQDGGSYTSKFSSAPSSAPPAPAPAPAPAAVGDADEMPLSEEQQWVYDQAVEKGLSIFFTGSAGTGKSYLLRKIIAGLKSTLRHSGWGNGGKVYVTAPTGIAACNIGGTTIHSFAGIGIDDSKTAEEMYKQVKDRGARASERWKECRVLVIDEVSMLDGNLFDKLDYIARKIRGKESLPFGGIQLVLAGDFYQLPPVGLTNKPTQAQAHAQQGGHGGGQGGYQSNGTQGKGIFQQHTATVQHAQAGGNRGQQSAPHARVPPIFCFDAKGWNDALAIQVALRKVFRQSDETFVRILNEIRVGTVTPQTEAILNQAGAGLRALLARPPRLGEPTLQATKLHTRNVDVDTVNAAELRKCGGESVRYKSIMRGEENFVASLRNSCPAPDELELKVGAQVMLLKNLDAERGLVNGARGVVVEFVNDEEERMKVPVVRFKKVTANSSGEPEYASETLKYETWSMESGGRVVAEREQIPLKLAYALTVHKSQGMTIDMLQVDLDGVFEHGQAYVALSRAVSLDNVIVQNFKAKTVTAHEAVTKYYRQLEANMIRSMDQTKQGGGSNAAAGSRAGGYASTRGPARPGQVLSYGYPTGMATAPASTAALPRPQPGQVNGPAAYANYMARTAIDA